jgi:hypothetical protein
MCCKSISFLTSIKFVLWGSMLQAFERHLLTALPFLLQSLIVVSFPRERVIACLNKAVILKQHCLFCTIYYHFRNLAFKTCRISELWGAWPLVNLLQKIRRMLLVLALVPLKWLEEKEKERKLQERLKRR